ncbi:MAG: alpha/beta hydrolase [Gemmataceae bacterium]|nr:alpha/beta hydrolase [Gemmataceae bacterium]
MRHRLPLPWRPLNALLLGCLVVLPALAGPEGAPRPAKKNVSVEVPPDVVFCPDLTYCTHNQRSLQVGFTPLGTGCLVECRPCVGERCVQLSIAHPKNGTGPFPAVVLIHGGGWLYGNHRDYVPLGLRLAQKGYVAATISYRLATVEPFPAAVHDVKCAVRWLRKHAEKYRVDRDRIGVYGHSAGGHLACMLGVAGGVKELEGNGGCHDQPSDVRCVVCCSGLTDLEHLHGQCVAGKLPFYGSFTRMAIEQFMGGPPRKFKERYAQASPITYASKTSMPTLLIHGTRDPVVPLEQSQRLEKRLREVGAEVRLLALKDATHSFNGEHAEQAEAAALAFFDRHLSKAQAKR